MHFFGNIEAKIDSKGRFFIPVLFRKILLEKAEEKIVLCKDLYQPCLVLIPMTVWNTELNELKSKLNKWNPQHQLILRQYVSDVEILNIDTNGRILLPKRYQELANINNDIRLIGMDDKIEIWAKELTNAPFMDPEEFSANLFQIMNDNDRHE
ncbi:division/cell wall cluster transcriptional repressor MraZ [Bacteroides sp.]|uniref:division/cell wall cluster transcriptional repressor MraZ n=1 Tax=Bacteroides sp. TaxID=29523 RepID=UPI0025900AE4|nr:division/cell wall cluster transcriptional repressor MraZ [Bacteroides sp.]